MFNNKKCRTLVARDAAAIRALLLVARFGVGSY